jgi:pyrroloquinoline quinone (PQQ) biosynthesis protein C
MSIVQLPKVRDLADIASAHQAVHHPYLQALARGDLPNPQAALVDFAIQYQGYTSWFPKYLHCVLPKLTCERHRGYFAENLAEEKGHLDAETIQQLEALGIPAAWVQGIPHPDLFRRFQASLGVHAGVHQLCPAALEWRHDFHSMLQSCSAAEAIGAMGLGTESIVKHIYRYITKAIQRHTSVDRKDYVFFELHSEVDEEHAELMLRVADDLVEQSPASIEQIQRGMIKALDLRAAFWESMYDRAGAL